MASQWEHIKWIPGTKLMVDGFRFQSPACNSYLLTHFHSDHTTGLYKSFNAGLIFCTPVTATLLRKDMGMPAERICPIPLDETVVIEGTEVTPIDANHCPGACMFLFRLKPGADGKRQVILHTGDLRWSDRMAEHPKLKGQIIDVLFLDTTYAKPQHTHPPQDECIAMMAKVMKERAAQHPRTLFVCGSYHIGKERAYLGAAKLLGWKVWCDSRKRRVLKMLDLPADLMAVLTTSQAEAHIHVDSLGALNPERLQQRMDNSPWTHAVAFRPTGWTFRRSGGLNVRTEGNVSVYGIPYSEHSSWTELRACVAALRPRRLVPTVAATDPAALRSIVNRFADLMDLSGDRSRLDFFLCKTPQAQAGRPPAKADVKAEQGVLASSTDDQAEGMAGPRCATEAGACVKAELGSPPREAACGDEAPSDGRGGAARAAADGASQEAAECADLEAVDVGQQQRLLRYFQAERKRRQEAAPHGGSGKQRATLACFFTRSCSRPQPP